MDMASISGPTEESSMEIGSVTRCMEKEYSPGMTEGGTKETTRMIRSMAMASSPGQMADSTMEPGCTESRKE